jgi:hypothetical protein
MVWNASRPADSDRIRLSAGLIRDNFQAIELGNVPYDTISLQNQAMFPALAGHNRLYAYTSGVSGNIELRDVNNAGQTVLLTEGGLLGASTQNARFSSVYTGNISFDGTFPYTGALMVNARASVSSGGSASQSVNMTASRTGTGEYLVTIPAGILTVNSYQVQVTPFYDGQNVLAGYYNKSTVNPANPTTFRVHIATRSGGNAVDNAFEVVVIGGRP